MKRYQEAYRSDILTPNSLTTGTGLFLTSTRNHLNTKGVTGATIATTPTTVRTPVIAASETTRTLTVKVSGRGTVTTSNGYTCSSATCVFVFVKDSQVTMTATPNTGVSFSRWGGSCSSSRPTCTVTMSRNKSVSATFKSAGSGGGGGGGSTPTPTPIAGVCGTAHGQTYSTAPTTNLCTTGTASSVTTNSTSYTWSCAGTDGGATTQCSASQTQTAPVSYTLTVSAPTNGTITGTGISCPGDCTQTVTSGTNITLTATPSTNYAFSAWGGACSGTTNTCTVSVTEARMVSATFSQTAPTTYTLTTAVSGGGTISGTGIACGTDCTEAYNSGTSVSLTATPGSGHTFAGWSGACSGTQTTCTVSMTQARSVQASFAVVPTTPPPTNPPSGSSYNVSTRIAEFVQRHRAVRVAAGQSDSSSFSSLTLPTAPTINTRVTVSNATEMAAAMAQSNIEVTFAGSGFTGTLNLNGRSDQRWIFPAGFTLTAPTDGSGYAIVFGNAQRIELVGTGGGRVVGGIWGGPTDLRIRDMDIRTRTNSSAVYLDTHSLEPCTRVLIEGSYLFARSYAMLYGQCTNFIVANSEVVSAGEHATARTSRSDLVLWMDSRLVTSASQMLYRAHENTNRFAGWNLQLEGGTGVYVGPAGTTGLNVQDLVLLDNAYYGPGQAYHTPYTSGGNPNITMATIVNNRAYTSWTNEISSGPGWIVSTNPVSAQTSAPTWTRRPSASTGTPTPTTYTLTVTRTGNGTISGTGISCGSDCSETYTSGTSVTLTAAPSTGYTFSGWGGACPGTNTTCIVSMTQARSVSATFTQTPIATNGQCGTSNGGSFTSAPSTNLCTQGNPSSVTTNTSTYTWSCAGTNGGTTAQCSATRTTPPTGGGTTYYFSDCQSGAASGCVPGNNANAGTSMSAPKRDLSGMSINSLGAGTNLLFARGGSWTNFEIFEINNPNVSASQPLTFDSYTPSWGGSARPILNVATGGTGFHFGEYGDTVYDGGYIVRNLELDGNDVSQWGLVGSNFHDLIVENMKIHGFEISMYAAHSPTEPIRNLTFRNNEIRDNSVQGFLGSAVNLLMEGNTFENNNVSGGGFEHGIYLGGNGGSGIIRNNTLNYNSAPGGVCTGGNITVHGQWDALTIEGNTIRQSSALGGCYGISVTTGYAYAEWFRNLIVRNNTIYNVGYEAIVINSAPNALVEGNRVKNTQSQYQNGVDIAPGGSGDEVTTNVTVRDNTICFATNEGNAVRFVSPASGTQTNNVYRTGADSTTGACAF